ncbi:MAG TPA: uracil-DNA glycosylase [Planctomycetota bacterium]|nr:uracil-DNA glycosylase [Planctomycetota bacterium]
MSSLRERIIVCRRCPRLVAYREKVAREKRRAYRDETYWGKPVPAFGVAQPRLMVVGLAPGAHGSNRTGRMFTGDASGDWLYRAMHLAGFASQPSSVRRGDGLKLTDALVTAAARCAPPDNKPTPKELSRCRPYLVEEIAACRSLRVVIALGRVGMDAFLKAWTEAGHPPFTPKPPFLHGGEATAGGVTLLISYHPSRQNTQTGKLTRAMFEGVFRRARKIISG